MTTIERITAALKTILDDDRRADRERIAELERDNNAVVQCCAELREAIDSYLAEIQRLTEKCAALVVENKRLAEYAGNWVDVPPLSDVGCTHPECGPACRRDCPPAREKTEIACRPTPRRGRRDGCRRCTTSHKRPRATMTTSLGWNTIGALAYADKCDADAELKRLGRPALLDDVHVTTMSEWRRVMS